MKAYTISKLAQDAGVSIHVVRDYELRGLLHPAHCTPKGYRIYDEQTLQRLQFVLAGKAAGISLNTLKELCQAIDNNKSDALEQNLFLIQESLEQYQQAILTFSRELRTCIGSDIKMKAMA